jgi:hypothetical protein
VCIAPFTSTCVATCSHSPTVTRAAPHLHTHTHTHTRAHTHTHTHTHTQHLTLARARARARTRTRHQYFKLRRERELRLLTAEQRAAALADGADEDDETGEVMMPTSTLVAAPPTTASGSRAAAGAQIPLDAAHPPASASASAKPPAGVMEALMVKLAAATPPDSPAAHRRPDPGSLPVPARLASSDSDETHVGKSSGDGADAASAPAAGKPSGALQFFHPSELKLGKVRRDFISVTSNPSAFGLTCSHLPAVRSV